MKASQAPEKLYIFNPEKREVWFSKTSDKQVEYTRTDAFIEKVESFLNRKDDRDSYTIGYIRIHLKEIIKEVGL